MGKLGRTTPQYGLNPESVERELLAAVKRAPWFHERVQQIIHERTDFSPTLPIERPVPYEFYANVRPPLDRDAMGLPVLRTRSVTITVDRRRRGRGRKKPWPFMYLRAEEIDARGLRWIQYSELVLN